MSDKDISDPANAEHPPPDAAGHGADEECSASAAHAGHERGSDEASLQPGSEAEPDGAKAPELGAPELASDAPPADSPQPPVESDAQLAFEFVGQEQHATSICAIDSGSTQPESASEAPPDTVREQPGDAAPVCPEAFIGSAAAGERSLSAAQERIILRPPYQVRAAPAHAPRGNSLLRCAAQWQQGSSAPHEAGRVLNAARITWLPASGTTS